MHPQSAVKEAPLGVLAVKDLVSSCKATSIDLNEYGEANDIIMVYPQAQSDYRMFMDFRILTTFAPILPLKDV